MTFFEKARLQIKADIIKILRFDPDEAKDIVACFDPELNYIFANPSACSLLGKEREELEGKNMLQLFPPLIASVSHRSLLSALSGRTVLNVISEGNITKEGARFLTDYHPLSDKGQTYAAVALTRKIYFP